MTEPCKKEEVIEMLHEDIKEIKGDVKEILKWKAYVIGAAATVSFIIGVAGQLFGK